MSTRSTIKVNDKCGEKFYIYRHCDGYPHGECGVLSGLTNALEFAWALPRFEAGDFAAAIVRAWKEKGGGNIYFTQGHDKHADTSYQYNVTENDGRIWLSIDTLHFDTEKNRIREKIFKGFLDDAVNHFMKTDH